MLLINDKLSISEEELEFTASHSSGPGGQNVNKVSTSHIIYLHQIYHAITDG